MVFLRSNSINLETLIRVCLIKKVNKPDINADRTMKIIFCTNSAFKKSNSIVFFNEYCSINVMELPIKFGATKAKILAIIVIIIPTIILDLYLKKKLI